MIIQIDEKFKNWVIQISEKYKNSQIKAAVSVNGELIKFYFELGKEISENSFKSKYGVKFYKKLSDELLKILGNVKGLSSKSLRYMEKFFLLYKDEIQIVPQLVGQLALIPWGHHRFIIDKCKNCDEAIFFVKKIIENNWSRNVLLNFLETDLYKREKHASNNFDLTVPDSNKDLAKEMLKDPYSFEFLSISKEISEKELKDSLVDNIQKFLLELGTGFAFVGRENRLIIGDSEFFTDLLFYNIRIHAYVVIEVKVSKFKPTDLGQLSFYVTSVNHLYKGDRDNPTLGILICKEKDEIVAEYSLENYNVPLGISTYEINKILPIELQRSLPTKEDIERSLKSK